MYPSILLSFLLLPLYTNRWITSSTPLQIPSITQSGTYNKSPDPVTSYSRPLLLRDLPRSFPRLPLFEVIGAGWAAASLEYQAIYPSEGVDSLLADFYHSIVSMCMAMTASNAPLAPYGGIFISGGLELAFDSTTNPIPWSLLRAFADWMILTTDRGFTSTYTIWFTHAATGRAIRFILRAGDGAPVLPP